jgi:hypothetical protein
MDTNKRQFIFFLGVGWCGTSSLWYTLTQIHDHLHTGITKRAEYLRYLSEYRKIQQKFDISDISLLPEISQEVIKSLNNYNEWLKSWNDAPGMGELAVEKNTICITPPKDKRGKRFTTERYKDFHSCLTDEVLDEITSFPPSIEKFMKYHDLVAEKTKGIFQYVGNFANENLDLTEDDLICVKDNLSTKYNIKSLIIFRDPIRRSFSHANYLFSQAYREEKWWTYEDYLNKDAIKVFKNYICDQKIVPRYTQKVLQLQQIFGKDNVCYLIMEDFFKDEQNNPEVSKLENYMGVKFNSIFPCAFVPDKGINAPRLPILNDQWQSDIKVLTPELYEWALSLPHIQKIYKDFEELHGCLPADWGRPIDYGY